MGHRRKQPKKAAVAANTRMENFRLIGESRLGGGGNRADWIRTSDLLNPIQAHYQAVLQPAEAFVLREGCNVWPAAPVFQVPFSGGRARETGGEWTIEAYCCKVVRVRSFFHLFVLPIVFALGGCAALIEAPLERKVSSLSSTPLLEDRREALLGWLDANSTFAFSHARGVKIAKESGQNGRYLVQIEGTERELAGGLAAAVTFDGYYVTASHVLEDNEPVLLLSRTPEGLLEERARVVWRSSQGMDLALIKGPPRGTCFPIAEATPRIGEIVLAGGATGGDSAGRVLSVNRRRILHSAPLRRGDSGGPLINTSGEIVGVNRAIHYDIFRGRRNEATIIPPEEILSAIKRDRKSRSRATND